MSEIKKDEGDGVGAPRPSVGQAPHQHHPEEKVHKLFRGLTPDGECADFSCFSLTFNCASDFLVPRTKDVPNTYLSFKTYSLPEYITNVWIGHSVLLLPT